ncbi:uncharacterized protein LOC133777911 [Humulus lupulus]|uniref:uncharacterized protein LOC133777911 n=1 Tax=Humulus lupulus TaxID=3486 RepID=UPI002B40C881|nr:uncharacterized protein LOC133777911 [Humulus lupulus]
MCLLWGQCCNGYLVDWRDIVMDSDEFMYARKGGSITRPPLLNDSNYPYWKVMIRAFIKSQEEKVWRSILSGWTPPSESDDVTKLKSELNWTDAKDKLSSYNNKALHAILNGFGEGYIKLISSCESTKEAWEILQTQFEGTADVKHSRLIMLTTRFENLRMIETESLIEFYERLFQTKLTAIEEAKDLETMKVEELMGSLRTFELNQQIRQKEKPSALKEKSDNKRVVCLNNIVQEDNFECESSESDLDEDSLKESYKDMYDQWLKENNDELENTVKNLEDKVIAKDCEIKILSNEINHMVKGVKMLNSNSRILDDVMGAGQKVGTSQTGDSTKVKPVSTSVKQANFLKRTKTDREKSDTFDAFKNLCIKLRVEKDCNIGKIVRIRSDHGISHEFSAPKTPEQNGVVERKNRTLQEMARVMLNKEIDMFIAETSQTESPAVTIGDVVPSHIETVATEAESVPTSSDRPTKEGQEIITDSIQREPSARIKKNHPSDLILGDIEESMVTRKRYVNLVQFVCFTSSFEPKNVKEALNDESWIKAMQEELEQFTRNESEDGTFISQSKYAKNLVKKFGMESAKHDKTPRGTMVKLTKDETGVKVNPTLYRSMIGSLLYLTASHPDISYSVGVCA